MLEPASRPALGQIRAVTYAVADPAAMEAAYVGELGYHTVARGQVTRTQALAWDAPAVEGRRLCLLAPKSGEPVFLRLVESPSAAGWRALKTWGWNATEFVVQDLDALAARLERGAFAVIGPPAPLTRFPMIRAMQVIGPAGECCYFTEIGQGSGLDLAPAASFVGRVFIVVAAGPDVERLHAPYAAFANPLQAPVATPVRVISDAHGLPRDTPHRRALVRLPPGCLLQLDAYPASATARTTPQGELPPGMAMVGFEVDRFDGLRGIGPPAPCDLPGVEGVGLCLRGSVGELIELVGPMSNDCMEVSP